MEKLSERDYPIFESIGHTYTLHPGELLCTQGEQSANIYLVRSGRVRMFCGTENGKEITYRILGEGQLLGEAAFFSHLQPASVSAVTDTVLIVCPIASLYSCLAEHAELSRMIFGLLAENTSALCRQIRFLTTGDAQKRIASFLLENAGHDDPELGILHHTLPYTQEELAVCLNLHRTTVARILSGMQKSGIVCLRYKQIQVVDKEKLETLL